MPGARKLMAAAGRHRRTGLTAAAGAAVMATAGAWLVAGEPAGTHQHQIRAAATLSARTDFLPSQIRCSWPIQVYGRPYRGQPYLARCYLRSLAHRDAAIMHELSDFVPRNNFQSRITSRDMTHSADARAGVTAVTFVQNNVDSAQTAVEFTFADGARETLQLVDMSVVLADPAPVLGDAWRFEIGSDIKFLG